MNESVFDPGKVWWDGYNEGKEDEMRRQIIGYACELSSMLLRLGDDSLTQRIAKELAEDGGFTYKEEKDG